MRILLDGVKIISVCKSWDNWNSYHLYYHEDLNRVVLGFVHPTILALHKSNWIDGFFFVRYGLGGPHIRLRVRPAPGCSEAVDQTIHEAAEEFLIRSPSTASLQEEILRKAAEAILSADPHETDGTIHPDNTFIAVSFRPEIARYGGADLLPHSLDLFTVSSIAALDFLTRFREEPRSRQLILAFRLLLRQALGFAADPDEMLTLLAYGVLNWGEAFPAILDKGDRVFAAQREILCRLFNQEVSEFSSGTPPSDTAGYLGEATRLLSRAVSRDDRRRSIGVSQLHMTATRLGLINPEEAYVSRLLSATAQNLLSDDAEARSRIAKVLAEPWCSTGPAPAPGSLLPRAFALLDTK